MKDTELRIQHKSLVRRVEHLENMLVAYTRDEYGSHTEVIQRHEFRENVLKEILDVKYLKTMIDRLGNELRDLRNILNLEYKSTPAKCELVVKEEQNDYDERV